MRAQNNEMDFFAGTWEFEGKFPGSENKEPAFKATWQVEKNFDSTFCLTGKVIMNGRATTRELMVYDPAEKQFRRTVIAEDGNLYQFTSAGWKNDKLTWTGTKNSSGNITMLKEELTRRSSSEFTAVYYTLSEKNEWELLITESLKKNSR